MTPYKKETDNETLKIPIGKGTIGYRLLLLAGTAFLGVQQSNSLQNQDSLIQKLERIEYQQTNYIKSIEKLESRIDQNDLNDRIRDEKTKNTIDDMKDKYIFNNPYFKSKNN